MMRRFSTLARPGQPSAPPKSTPPPSPAELEPAPPPPTVAELAAAREELASAPRVPGGDIEQALEAALQRSIYLLVQTYQASMDQVDDRYER